MLADIAKFFFPLGLFTKDVLLGGGGGQTICTGEEKTNKERGVCKEGRGMFGPLQTNAERRPL
jgi:hypothetical protein